MNGRGVSRSLPKRLWFKRGIGSQPRIQAFQKELKDAPDHIMVKKDARLAKSMCIRVKEKATDYVKDKKPAKLASFQSLVELLTGKLHEDWT